MAEVTETPKFELISKTSVYEIRKYMPQLRAEFSYNPAHDRGFNALASYIFGNNRIRSDSPKSTKIAMTAPVIISSNANTTIAMTSPVTTSRIQNLETMSFIMPRKFQKITDLPIPVDPQVTLTERLINAEKRDKKERELREACQKDHVDLMTGEGSAVLFMIFAAT
ncbi:regulatory factor, effector binding domain-containing protein [Chytridium lagenaria]|nr:regulatory factor, effector binding domain-containing protein [Chytridium lagenaria]